MKGRARQSKSQELEAWRRAMRSREPTRRTDAANAPPPGAPAEKVVPLLLRALDDQDELVRTCAADSLEQFPCDDVCRALRVRAGRERDPLARGYMLYSLGRIGTLKDLAFVCTALTKNRTIEDQSFGVHGLFLGIRRIAIEALLPILKAPHLPSLIGVCRTLADVCMGSDDPRVITAIQSRMKTVTGNTVVDINRELQDIIANYELNAGERWVPARRIQKRSKPGGRREDSTKK